MYLITTVNVWKNECELYYTDWTNSGAIFFENCGLWLPIQKVQENIGTHAAEKPRSTATKTQKRTHFIERQKLKLLYFAATL